MTKITSKLLKEWRACEDGYKKFCELFPKGADLQTASKGLIEAGHPDWSNWLWQRCAISEDLKFKQQTVVVAAAQGTASAGYLGTASAGYLGTASAGDRGTASAGYLGTASAGYLGTASAGDRGTASAGEEGVIAIEYYNGDKYKKKIGQIGEGGLKPKQKYKLDDNHNFIETE